MNLNDIIIVGGIATFLLPIVYLMGYARYEKQYKGWAANARIGFKNERDAIRAQHMDELVRERNVIRELEISLHHASEAIELGHQDLAKMTKQWEFADKYRKTLVQAMIDHNLWKFDEHSASPMLMLALLCKYVADCAVDPTVNQKAKNLHTRGVRKGAKMGREQMRKLMQKSIDNQANLIENLRADLDNAAAEADGMLIRRTRFRNAVMNVLDDKIALVSVRRALKIAITTEVARLRLVDSKKGE